MMNKELWGLNKTELTDRVQFWVDEVREASERGALDDLIQAADDVESLLETAGELVRRIEGDIDGLREEAELAEPDAVKTSCEPSD